ncbi:MAG: hypothetical protein H6832_18580 [Planctomycetes bacterium]|nr:hypothetical protein [Planctomycetota bacterium]
MQRPVLTTLLLFAGVSCVSTDYAGKSYAPTSHVDVFFDTTDVERKHETMGELKGEATQYNSYEQIEQKMVQDAMAKGADAILFYDLSEVTVGSTTSSSGQSDEVRYTVDKDGNLKKHGSGGWSSSATTNEIKDKVIKAKLLKYK